MDPSKDPTFRVQADGLYLQQTVTTNNTVTVDWIYCPAKCKETNHVSIDIIFF